MTIAPRARMAQPRRQHPPAICRVEALQRRAIEVPGALGLSGGLPADRLFPAAALSRAVSRVFARRAAMALQYGWPEGDETLRAWIAERMRTRALDVGPSDVIITNGAQQAIGIAMDVLAGGLDPGGGDRVGVDAATYPAVLDLLRARGTSPAVDPASRIAYTMPVIQNPRGLGLSPEERAALVASGAALIEDDAYAELRFDGRIPPPLAAAARHRVWYVGTFSKTLAPGLRVGWLVPPPDRLREALKHKHAHDLQANSFAQAVLAEFLAHDDVEARLARARAHYAANAARLAEALHCYAPRWRFTMPEGGFSIWVTTDIEGDDTALLERAIAERVTFDPGSQFYAAPPGGPISFRLCYSAIGRGSIDTAVRRLVAAVEAFARAPGAGIRPAHSRELASPDLAPGPNERPPWRL